MRKLSPLNQFKRILIPLNEQSWNLYRHTDSSVRIFPETIFFEEEINPLSTTDDCRKVITKLQRKMSNELNLRLYKLVKNSIKDKQIRSAEELGVAVKKSTSYLQMGKLRLSGGMYLLIFENFSMKHVNQKLFAWLQYGAFVDLKEIYEV